MKEGHTSELRELVQQRHGDRQRELLQTPLNSFARRLAATGYHADEAQRIIKAGLSQDTIATETWAAFRRFAESFSSLEVREEFSTARFTSECHVIAAAQSLHASTDILAKVVYISLDLPSRIGTVSDRQQNPWNIRDKLRGVGYASEVADSLDALVKDAKFQYLRAYVNTSKHQQHVGSNYQIDFESTHGIHIKAFEYEGESFGEKWAKEFTIPDAGYLHNVEMAVIGEVCDVLKQELGTA